MPSSSGAIVMLCASQVSAITLMRMLISVCQRMVSCTVRSPVVHRKRSVPTDLVPFLATTRPLVVDTVLYSWNRSISGAVGLQFAGLGGSFTDEAQDRLRGKMLKLAGGNPRRPIVTIGWNAEHFDGRNLALRLASLGYTNVYWYRGGREAWEVNGLPETNLDVQQW